MKTLTDFLKRWKPVWIRACSSTLSLILRPNNEPGQPQVYQHDSSNLDATSLSRQQGQNQHINT